MFWRGAVFIMSKIQIESNSQPPPMWPVCIGGCIYHVKDTNRKQFTTLRHVSYCPSMLYLSCQRYKSKAIHNEKKKFVTILRAVFIMSKIQIESNSQPTRPCDRYVSAVFIMSKIQIESNSQLDNIISDRILVLYLSCQRYKSKAIHNHRQQNQKPGYAVFIMSKIQIESNSQRDIPVNNGSKCCIYHVKDTNRKQFTTNKSEGAKLILLYLSCQRYKSKAIHNDCF